MCNNNSLFTSIRDSMEHVQQEIIKRYIRAYNEFDVDGMLTDVHQEVVFENIANGVVNLSTKGIVELREQAEAAKNYFKERQQTITFWNFQESTVRIGINYVGVLAVDLPNGKRAGETLELSGESEFEFAEGKIIRITDRSWLLWITAVFLYPSNTDEASIAKHLPDSQWKPC